MEYFKKAIENSPKSELREVYRRRFHACSRFDLERSIDDYARINKIERMRLVGDSTNRNFLSLSEDNDSDEIHQKIANKVFSQLKKKKKTDYRVKDVWFKFMKDKLRFQEEKIEKKEIESLKKELEGKRFKDLYIYRRLGSGAYGSTYICQIPDVFGCFVMKFFNHKHGGEVRKKMIERECIDIPIHRNVVPLLSHRVTEMIDLKKLTDYETHWKDFGTLTSGMIIMKYYQKDLSRYLKQRKRYKTPFEPLEVCYIIDGLLRGGSHLHDNKIVHRDLHPGNVFVDEVYGRVFIGDLGCALDLRGKEGFIIMKTDEILLNLNSEMDSFMKGGAPKYLPPEVLDSFQDMNVEFLDYRKSDLYSIGIIGKQLIHSFETKSSTESFGYIKSASFPSKNMIDGKDWIHLSNLIERMLYVEVSERIDFGEAIKELEEIVIMLECSVEKIKKQKDEIILDQ